MNWHILALFFTGTCRTFQMNGTSKTIYGTMATASADNTASNALGGFKEGFTAFRHCRQCMGTAQECKQQVSGPPSDYQRWKVTYEYVNRAINSTQNGEKLDLGI